MPATARIAAVLIVMAGFHRTATAAALDLRQGETLREVYGVEIVGVGSGELSYRLFKEIDAGVEKVHRVRLDLVERIKDQEAATFTHAEWQRTEVLNWRMAEDGYKQAIEESTTARRPKWSVAVSWARLLRLYWEQERLAEAVDCLRRLALSADGAVAFLPAGDLRVGDPRAYNAGVRAVHAEIARWSADARVTGELIAFADRLEFQGSAASIHKGLFGIEDADASRLVFVVEPEPASSDPTVRRALASMIRGLAPGVEFAVFLGSEAGSAPIRRVGMGSRPVRSDTHEAGKLVSVRVDPRVVHDPLPNAKAGVGDELLGLAAAMELRGVSDPTRGPDAVFVLVSGPPRRALVAPAEATARVHVIRIPRVEDAHDADAGDKEWERFCRDRGGKYVRLRRAEWTRLLTCR